jgi:hypothetical protein
MGYLRFIESIFVVIAELSRALKYSSLFYRIKPESLIEVDAWLTQLRHLRRLDYVNQAPG